MMLRTPSSGRHGISLLEVLIALAIFLFALIVIGRLVTLGGDRALDVQQYGQAAQLCQSKLAEVMAGAVPLTPQTDVAFEEDPSWSWSLEADQADVAGLWKVSVRVSRQRPDGSRVESSLYQMVLDPSLRGSTLDAAAAATATNSGGSSSNTANTSGPSSGGGMPSSSSGPLGSGATGRPSGGGVAGAASGSGTKGGGSTGSPSASGSGPKAPTGGTSGTPSSGSSGTKPPPPSGGAKPSGTTKGGS